jgi:hypothetical protein
MKEIVLPYVSIKFTDSIIYCKFKEGIELGFPEVKEVVSCIEGLGNEKPYLILSDVRFNTNITQQGKRMLGNYINLPFCNGTAILIDENRYECAQNFVNTYNTKYPFRAFSSEKEAENWLLSLSIDC